MTDKRAAAARINGQLGGRPAERGERSERVSARMTATERAVVEQAAAIDGQSWTSWMIAAAVAAARRKLAKVSRETT